MMDSDILDAISDMADLGYFLSLSKETMGDVVFWSATFMYRGFRRKSPGTGYGKTIPLAIENAIKEMNDD